MLMLAAVTEATPETATVAIGRSTQSAGSTIAAAMVARSAMGWLLEEGQVGGIARIGVEACSIGQTQLSCCWLGATIVVVALSTAEVFGEEREGGSTQINVGASTASPSLPVWYVEVEGEGGSTHPVVGACTSNPASTARLDARSLLGSMRTEAELEFFFTEAVSEKFRALACVHS